MSHRSMSWLAPIAVVAVMAAGAGIAIHSQAHPAAAANLAQSRVDSATDTVYAGNNDPAPANSVHSPLPHVPPAASPTPSHPPSQTPATKPPRAVPPVPTIVIGSYQQTLINRDRAAAGLRPLTWSSCLAKVAAANAVRLSRQGWVQPYHTNGASLDLNCHLGRQAGENVGYWSGGINDAQLNAMFMNSPEHRANIMGPYHYVATAWAVGANGAAYIAVEFS